MYQSLLEQLTTLWHEGIPMAKGMQIKAAEFDGVRFTTTVPWQPNQNHHNSQFAGSIYSQATLTGWGRIWLALQQQGLDGTIVLAQGEIRYRKPITEPLPCHCDATDIDLSDLKQGKNAKIALNIDLDGYVEFLGHYAVLPH